MARRRRRRKIILTEFSIQVFSDGTIDWNGFDKFLQQRIGQGLSSAKQGRSRLFNP